MKFKDLHINIKIRLFINFFQKLTQMTVFPFMAIYFSTHFGLKLAGLLMIFSVIAALFSSFYGGYFADKIGRKKVLLEGEKYRFFTMILMAVFNSSWLFDPVLTYIFFFINSIVVGIITPANEAILIDVSTSKTRKMIYSLSYWSINFSIALGSMIGAFFYRDHFFILLLSTALASLVSYYVIRRFIIETNPSDTKKLQKVSFKEIFCNYKVVLKDRLFAIYLVAGICMLSLEFQLINFIAVKLSDEFGTQNLFGFESFTFDGVKILGLLRMENTLLVVLLGALVLKLTNNINDKVTLYVGAVLFSCGFALLAVYNNAWILIIATLIFTIGELMYVPIHQSLLPEIINDEMRSQYIAVNSLRVRGAMIVGALGVMLGAIIPNWTMALIYLFLGGFSIYLYIIVYSKIKDKTFIHN
jgi:DHA1 family multidrug resistance protein B-like MFS transporter